MLYDIFDDRSEEFRNFVLAYFAIRVGLNFIEALQSDNEPKSKAVHARVTEDAEKVADHEA